MFHVFGCYYVLGVIRNNKSYACYIKIEKKFIIEILKSNFIGKFIINTIMGVRRGKQMGAFAPPLDFSNVLYYIGY